MSDFLDDSGDFGAVFNVEDLDFCNQTQDEEKDTEVLNLIDNIAGIGEGTQTYESECNFLTKDTNQTTLLGLDEQTQKSGINNEDYFKDTINGTLDATIKMVSEKLLNSKAKTHEIERFKMLLKEFQNWFLSNERNFEEEVRSRDYVEADVSPVSAYEFVIYDNDVNAFTLPFSDVYINLVALKKLYKRNALLYMSRYLRNADPNAYVQEFLADHKRTRRKIIFRFLDGKTKFIIMVNIELHLRLNMQFKLCTNVDLRFSLMGAFLSFWAHKRNILKDDYLNPHTLYLMLIYFLQVQQPPILPNLYNKKLNKIAIHKRFSSIKGISKMYEVKVDQNYETDAPNLKSRLNSIINNQTVGDLITRFFYMFAFDIPALKKRISIKKGCLVDCKRMIDGYSVEDPYIEDYDTCRNLNNSQSEAYIVVYKEFNRAYELIADGKAEQLCYEFKG